MDFGLGLVLSFTDNATAGINNAVNSLNNLTRTAEDASNSLNQMASLSALSVVSGQIGSSFTSMGYNIISTLGQVISKVNETGQTLMFAENQLGKLYEGSGKTGADVVSQIQEYAKKTIFEFEDLISVVTTLKAVGVEAFDEISSSAGNAYDLMGLASDLAAFNPNMRNMYGTGINAAMGALKEYIAEGNAMSLKRGAGLDITAILGEDKGATIEERSRQVADLLEKLGMVGMTKQLENTPMTKLSNMADTLFQFVGKISSSGVYDAYNSLISTLADYVSAITDAELDTLAKSIAGGITAILEPVGKVLTKLLSFVDILRQLVANNPNLAKFAILGSAIGGILLILTGVVLKATSAFSGLSLMILASGNTFASVGGVLKAGALKMMGVLLPLIATISLLALAWKNDFIGIRTNVTNFVSNLTSSFRTASQAVNGSVGEMLLKLTQIERHDDFFNNLTLGIMKFMMVFKALKDAWNDNQLSEDNFVKARALGVLPLVEAILDLKYRFGLFKDGFVAGWTDIMNSVKSAINGFTSNIKGTALEGFVNSLTSLLQKLASGDAQAWYDFGRSFADFTAKALAFVIAMKTLDGVLGAVLKIVAVFKAITNVSAIAFNLGKALGTAFNGIKTAFTTFLPWVSSIIGGFVEGIQLFIGGAGTLVEVLRTVFTPLAGVVAFVGGAILSITNFFDMLKDGFSWVKEALMIVGIAISTVGAIIAGVSALPAVIVGAIVGAVATIVVLVKQHWEQIKAVLSTIGGWIYNNVISPVVNFFNTYIFPIISKVVEVVAKVIEIIAISLGLLVSAIYTDVIEPIGLFFVGLWENIKEVFSDVAEWFGGVFSLAVEGIKSFFSPLVGFFKGVWDNIVSIFTTIGITIADTISSAVKGVLNAVLQGAVGIINGFIGAINIAVGALNAVPGVNISKLSKLEIPLLAQGGIVESPTLSMIGEQGREAVVPLENNVGWITNLANMISDQINEIRPTNTHRMTPSSSGQRMYNTNNTSTQNITGDTDNSVVFNAGAIQVNLQNATEAEAMKLAKTIMEYIKRQTELDNMVRYAN